jgi:hypothetical protein
VNVKLVAAGSAVVLALSGAGAAAAGSGQPGSAKQAPALEAVGSVFNAALAYLKLDRQTLAKDLMDGQSLAQIAVAQGKTSDGLVDTVVPAAKTQLDVAVTAGRLDSAREQMLLTKLRTTLTTLVTKNIAAAKPGGTLRPRPVTMFLQPLLAYLRLHLLTLPNHGPIVRGHIVNPPKGKLAGKLNGSTAIDTIIGRVKLKLDQSVASGRLTPAQAAAFLAKLQAAQAALTGSH